MCGRYSIVEISGLKERFNIEQLSAELKPRYNVAPTQDVPVILKNGSNRLELFRWGLIPRWAKDPSLGHKLINARAETLHEKPRIILVLTFIPAGFFKFTVNPTK